MKNKGFFSVSLLLVMTALFMWTGCPTAAAPELVTTFPVPINVITTSQDAQITVTWDEVDEADKYEVSYGVNDASGKTVVVTGPSAKLTGLLRTGEYQIMVRAGNGSFWSNWSSPVTATPKASTAGVALKRGWAAYEVLNINKWYADGADEDNTGGVIMVSWDPAEGAEFYQVFVATATKFSNTIPNPRPGSNGIYDIEADDVPPAGSTAIPPERPETPTADNVKTTSYFYRNAEGGKTYYMWVRAKNAQGYGDAAMYNAYLNPNKTIQQPYYGWGNGIERADYPQKPQTIVRDSSVTVSWDVSDRAAWYEVYYSTKDIGSIPLEERGSEVVPYKKLDQLQALTSSAVPWDHYNKRPGEKGTVYKVYALETTITGLENGKPYYIWIRSLNHNGERGLAKITVIPATPLSAPTNVTMTADKDVLSVKWNAVAGADTYRVYFSKYPSTPHLNALYYTTDETSYKIERNDPNTTYYVWVIAELDELPGLFSAPASAKTEATESGAYKVAKKTVNDDDFVNIVYVEVNDQDPRVTLGYVLDDADRTQFYDAVIIFAANLRVRNCAAEKARGDNTHDCYKNGPHVHLNANVEHVLKNRDKYIKPLQDAGIKVLLGTLPDHDNFSYYSLFQWPFETDYSWNTAGNPGKTFHSNWYTGDSNIYPFAADNGKGQTWSEVFMDDLVGVINEYGLDGFDVDNEYASDVYTKGLSIYTSIYGSTSTIKKAMGENLANFLLMGREKMDATTPAGAPKKWITVFEYSVWDDYMGLPNLTMYNGEPVSGNLQKYVNYAYEGIYGFWVSNSTNNFPNRMYGPYSINIWRVNPPPSSGFITDYMDTVLKQKNGCLMYFAPASLRDHTKMEGYNLLQGKSQAEYLSIFSEPLFGKKVIYVGRDYPQDWAKR